MKTLWLYPPAFPKEDPEGWQRRRFAKRARALAEALPAEGKVIFADPSVRSRAERLAASMGTIVRPIQEQNGSFRILSDIPQRMEEDLYEKTGGPSPLPGPVRYSQKRRTHRRGYCGNWPPPTGSFCSIRLNRWHLFGKTTRIP